MGQDIQDRIDQYLLGQMSEMDCLTFEQELEKYQDLKEQFEFTQKVKEAVTSRNKKLAQIREWKDTYDTNHMGNTRDDEDSRNSKRLYIYWISGIAALFVVGFFLFSPFVFETKEGVGRPIYVTVSNLRNGEDNTEIAKTINEGHYDLALSKIEEKVKKLESEILQTEQEKANMDEEEYSYLKEVHEIQMDELKLLKAYALFGLKRNKEAKSILDGIRQRESKFKAQADSLYNLYK